MSRAIEMNEKRRVVGDMREFGRVAVMLGGFSSERAVSLDTGHAVLKALTSRGVNAHAWDPAEHSLTEFAAAGFDRVWVALHGPGGEDGALQGALEWLSMPYTGSGVMASAIAMDKIRSKQLFEVCDLPTPDYAIVCHQSDAAIAAKKLGFPMIVKPVSEGSSVGISKVSASDELADAVALALRFDTVALAERCIVGHELTVAVLQGEALPSIRIETPRDFYDYRAKYESERTQYICPGTSDAAAEQRYAELAITAFAELGCSGWGRVDFMADSNWEPQILEVNTVPGMTSHSLVPMAAKQAGIDFEELCWRILETSVNDCAEATAIEVAANDA